MAAATSMSNEILEEFSRGARGCVLCSLWSREEATLTESIQKDDLSATPDMREKLVTSSGLCNRHTHAVHRATTASNVQIGLGSPQAARAVLKKYEESLSSILPGLAEKSGTAGPDQGAARDPIRAAILTLERTISGDGVCPVCDKLMKSDAARVAGLLLLIEGKDFKDAYAKSDALCMPHFVTAMRLLATAPAKASQPVWPLLVSVELARLTSINNLLEERMKKYTWDYRDEGLTPEEAGAQRTGMHAVVGAEGLYGRPRKTSLRPAN